MRPLVWSTLPVVIALALASSAPGQQKTLKIVWRKTVLDTKFRAEGVAVADVDKDGKKDILAGDLWYKGPEWKPNWIRRDPKGKEKSFNPAAPGLAGYSDTFVVAADDIDGDGWIDQVVVGFPNKPCHWYRNPGKDGSVWQEHLIQDSACNETPLYVDLFKSGKRGLILGHKGEMCYFTPGKDPTRPWERLSISGPSSNKELQPGTFHYAHGLGVGDINGDGLLDVMCGPNPSGNTTGGWWEQPAKEANKGKWKFHPAPIPKVADMYAYDMDGDGKNDIICTSAHNTGMYWLQQRAGKEHPAFLQQLLFPMPAPVGKTPPEGIKFSKDEAELWAALNKVRQDQKKSPWRPELRLCQDAKAAAVLGATSEDKTQKVELSRQKYPGEIVALFTGPYFSHAVDLVKEFQEKFPKARHPGLDLGLAVFEGASGTKFYAILLGDREQFVVPAQTHALHFVDIDGDGLKDLVTGRRYWAHGPTGDDTPGDPAFLYWLKAKKNKSGVTSFVPHMIDDDSGVGTQFAVEDVDGDGLLDVIVANKRGVFLFLQAREWVIEPVAPPVDDN